MRPRPGLAVLPLAAVLALGACGGSTDEGSPTADDDVQTFCSEVQQASTELASQLAGATPEQLPTLLQQAGATLGELDPPAELVDDVAQVRATYQQLVDAVAGLDLSTPEGQQAFSDAAGTVGLGSTPAELAIDDWTTANCGGAAPSS
ncbi:hypothetical protein SAMN03159343_1642 [Klenkia marina]|uniref:Uncharacterized protein n=1 Tax=Klenkia marina TaxID=1960309 RepID=A0A1G4XWU3_9ACTN|nr:hypothetical protein [Klenkia marina]SCX45662.1 hypothetical protein SAMN03159343_1642 [Klenkia marina]